MYALYAFMRHTDDLADGAGTAAEKEHALRLWQTELDAALAAEPAAGRGCSLWPTRSPAGGIPRSLLHEVIEGVSMDVRPRPLRQLR